MRMRVLTTLFVMVLAVAQCVLSVVPRDGLTLCVGRGLECVCPAGERVVVAPVACADACCGDADTRPAKPGELPRNDGSCGCGCFDVWLPGSVMRLDTNRVVEVTALVVAVIEPGPMELWALRICDAPAPDVNGPECCGPPLVVRTTRLLI